VVHGERLIALGGDTVPINDVGLNAFQLAPEQACRDADYATAKVEAAYERLWPTDLVLPVDGRLVKLDARSTEFLVLKLMLAMFYMVSGERVALEGGADTSGDIVDVLHHVPDAGASRTDHAVAPAVGGHAAGLTTPCTRRRPPGSPRSRRRRRPTPGR
jgi:hypothetical protein